MPVRAILAVILFFLLISLPFLVADLAGGMNWEFGGFLLNPLDGNSYLAKMYQGWRGDWRFTLPYTAQPGEGAYLFLFYLFLGHLARLTHLPLLVVFHLARLASAIILVWSLWRFLRMFFWKPCLDGQIDNLREESRYSEVSSPTIFRESPKINVELVIALALLGLGMGWLAFPFGKVTSDLWISEAYPFLSAYTNPHFVLGLALLLSLLTFPMEIDKHGEPRSNRHRLASSLLIGLLSLLLAIVSPFGVIVVLVILGGLLIVELGKSIQQRHHAETKIEFRWLNKISQRWGLVALFGIPWLLYYLWVVNTDPVLAGWNAQNLTSSPPPWDLMLSFSPALIMAIVGGIILFPKSDRRLLLLIVWAVAGILLIYLPFGLQRRFMLGLFLPITILAGFGIAWFVSLKPRFGRILGKVVLLLSIPSVILVLLIGQYGVQTHDPRFYLTSGEAQAFKWIEENTASRALILASPETGLYIPAWTGRRVIYGHPYETVNAEEEKRAVTRFFQGMEENEQYYTDFLSQRQVDYVFLGLRERQLGKLPELDALSLVYSSGDVEVYEYLR